MRGYSMEMGKPASAKASRQNTELQGSQQTVAPCKREFTRDGHGFTEPEHRGASSQPHIRHSYLGGQEFPVPEFRLWNLLDSAFEGVIVVDEQGRIIMVNSAVERMFGYDREAVQGQQLEMLLPESLRKIHGKNRREYLARPQARTMGIDMELSGRREDGSEIPIEARLNYIQSTAGLLAIAFVSDARTQKAAVEAGRSLDAIVKCADIAIFNATLAGVITSWNNGAETIYGYSADEMIGHSATRLMVGDHCNEMSEVLNRIGRGAPALEYETEHLRKDGEHICVSVTLSPLRNPKGRPEAASVMARDITRKKRAQQALGNLSKVFMEATDSIVIVDRNARIIDLNNETESAYGWRRDELIGQTLDILIAPEKRGHCPERIAQCLRGKRVRNILGERLTKGGDRIPVLLTSFPLTDTTGKPAAVAIMAKDNRELRQAQEDLERNEQELRNLSAKLMNAAEEESKRVARELHDYFGSRLAMLNLKVSRLEGHVSLQPGMAKELAEIRNEINEVAKVTHDLSHSLHSSLLLDLGVVEALETECATFSKLHGTTVEFSAERVPEDLSDAAALCLYRVAQESLQNIDRHADAATASVKLTGNQHHVRMLIQDDGCGFDPATARGRGRLGFVSMEERVRQVNGRLQVDSMPGAGTRVNVHIPLERE